MERRTLLKGFAGGAALSAVGLAGCASGSTGGEAAGSTSSAAGGGSSLVFDKNAFTELTTTISTSAGDKKVVYHFWKAIPYVTKPVDSTHQSLTVSVPVSIDGKAVDASNAPILLANAVGGYFPATVATSTGIDGATMEMGSVGGAAGGAGAPPSGAGAPPSGMGAPGGDANAMVGAGGGRVSLPKLALAAGYVVVEPGCRGRTLVDSSGKYYGTAPAAIVDLKAAVRYVKSNKGRIPGNVDHIVSTGTSAGGALSALLGASGDSSMYDSYLKEIGAADASDSVFATGAWCPITDLEHADMMYEWCWGSNKLSTGALVDQSVAKALRDQFDPYEKSLKVSADGFGPLNGSNFSAYLVATYLQPAATTYLKSLSSSDRATYLKANPFITWAGDKATFTWEGFTAHVGARKKNAPAFDAFDLSAGENNEFGLDRTQARHFTEYSLRHAKGSSAQLDSDIPTKLELMNPMYHLTNSNSGRSKHWWLRVGTKDTDSSPNVVANLALVAKKIGDDVNSLMYWDQGHGSNDDPADFMAWIASVTGYKA